MLPKVPPLKALFSNKPINYRRIRFFIIACTLGLLSNYLVINLPFAVPFLLGNVVFLTLYIRLGLVWALAALFLVMLPLQDSFYWWLAGWQLLVVMLMPPDNKAFNLRLVILAIIGKAICIYYLAPAGLWKTATDYCVVLLLLTANFILNLRAVQFLLTLSVSQEKQRSQLFRQQLSQRIALYSAIPCSIFISLILHSTITLHFSYFLNEHQRAMDARKAVLDKKLTHYIEMAKYTDNLVNQLATLAVLQQLVKTEPEIISALITDQDGNLQQYYLDGPLPNLQQNVNVAHRYYFYQPKATGKPAITDTFRGQGLGNDLLFAIGLPRYNADGNFNGVLQIAVALNRLTDIFTAQHLPQVQLLLLDRSNKKLWASDELQQTGAEVRDLHRQKVVTPGIAVKLGLPYPEQVFVNPGSNKIILQEQHELSGWVFYDQLETSLVKYHYHLFLAIALLLSYCLLELISRLSGIFARQYTRSLEQLAAYASDWHSDNLQVKPAPQLQANSLEFEALRLNLHQLQLRVVESQQYLHTLLDERTAMNLDLEQRVRSRTAELEFERDKAKQLAAIKTRFLANMSHEIRTPLTIISGYTEQLQKQTLPNTEQQTLKIIANSVQHLQAVVNDILDSAKLEEGKLAVIATQVDLQDFLDKLLQSFYGLAQSKGLHLQLNYTIAPDCQLTADPFRLQQILSNILSNAIKFTEAGEIVISVQQTEHDLTVTVQDPGIGMNQEQVDRLFSAFNQADASTSRRYGGTGLGLYISKNLAELMGFQLTALSHSGKGSRFSLLIPSKLYQFKKVALNQSLDRTENVNCHLPGKILIVDDVKEIRQLIIKQLKNTGAEVFEAEDGLGALTLARQHSFTLIILDQQMPGLDGFATAKALKELGSQAKLISLSADVYDNSQLQNNDRTFDLVLAKPISQSELLNKLAKLVAAEPYIEAKEVVVDEPDHELVLLQREYLEHLASELKVMLELTQHEHWHELSLMSHKIKGTSASLVLNEISATAKELYPLVLQASDKARIAGLILKLAALVDSSAVSNNSEYH